MAQKTKLRIRRSDEELALEALKYTRKVDFQNNSNAHYKQAWRRGKEFLAKITSHMDIEWEQKWDTIEEVQIEARKYGDRTSFARGSSGAYDKAQRMGWLDAVCSFMGEKSNEAWTQKELADLFLKYKDKESLRNENLGAYLAANRMGIVDDICSHMDVLWEKKWDTFEKIHEEALKYKRRGQFKVGSSGAWDAAIRLGILEEVTVHMKRSHSVSLKEEELYRAIKDFYITAKSTRSKVSIDGKDYIKRFDIDIFIPELMRGIEFDGTYYHSFEYMRKDKRKAKWSDEDIHNYHEIKDAWFATKGIQILHIKEEDWDLNEEECVNICLAFLRGENVEQVA